mgnify:CR=1 FL=1
MANFDLDLELKLDVQTLVRQAVRLKRSMCCMRRRYSGGVHLFQSKSKFFEVVFQMAKIRKNPLYLIWILTVKIW